jgi:hypothetical protein
MPIISIIKPDVVDDPNPNVVAPDPSRVFPISFFMLNGDIADRQLFKSRALAVSPTKDSPSAVGITTFDVQLFTNLTGTWEGVGPTLRNVASNRLASVLLPTVDTMNAAGFLQLTNITAAADAIGFEQVIYDADQVEFAPRSSRGFPEVGLPPLESWGTVGNKTAPDGANPPERIVNDAVFCERFFLLQADVGNPPGSFIEILGPTGLAGTGIQLEPGDSMEVPVYDIRRIYCHGNAAGLILHIAKF